MSISGWRTNVCFASWWKQFPRYWPFVRGIHRSPVNSPQKRRWRGAFMFSFICAWIIRWGWFETPSSSLWRHFNVLALRTQTSNVMGITRSKIWLLMSWLFVSPGHLQPWHWLCKINGGRRVVFHEEGMPPSSHCREKIMQIHNRFDHYSDLMMSAMASQITRVSICCLTVCSGADQRKWFHLMTSSWSMAFYLLVKSHSDVFVLFSIRWIKFIKIFMVPQHKFITKKFKLLFCIYQQWRCFVWLLDLK